ATVTLLRAAGTMLARSPHPASGIGNVYGRTSSALKDDQSILISRAVFGTDGKERILAARRIADFPLRVTAGLETTVLLADWRRETQFLIGVAAVSIILIGLIFFRIIRQLRQEHKNSRERLAREKLR